MINSQRHSFDNKAINEKDIRDRYKALLCLPCSVYLIFLFIAILNMLNGDMQYFFIFQYYTVDTVSV